MTRNPTPAPASGGMPDMADPSGQGPPVPVECPTCETVFGTKKAMRTHHTQVHGESLAEPVTCENPACGRKFNPRRPGGDPSYCSIDCKNAAQRRDA